MQGAGLPRPVWLACAAALTAVSCAAAAAARPGLLAVAACAGGAAFGGHWAVMAASVGDLFGAGSFATVYALLQLAPAAGSLALARGLAGAVYDAEAARQARPGGACLGPACFGPAFAACAAACVASAAAALALARRTRPLYAARVASLSRRASVVFEG